MYIPNASRVLPDKFLEPLAQAVCQVSRDNVADYHTSQVLAYALAKLVSRVAAIKYKKPTIPELVALEGAMRLAGDEFSGRVLRPALDKQKSMGGEVFGELL